LPADTGTVVIAAVASENLVPLMLTQTDQLNAPLFFLQITVKHPYFGHISTLTQFFN
jgi:hypothetical protein